MKLPFHLVIEFAHRYEDSVQEALLEFFSDSGFPDEGQMRDAFPLFDEWLIYDFKRKNGASFLAEYVLTNPDKLDDKTLSALHQVAESHWFGGFEIVSVKRSQWIELEHLFSGKRVKVHDILSSKSIPREGTLIGRIGKANDEWFFVGTNPSFLPMSYTLRMKKMMKDTSPYNSPKDVWALLLEKGAPSLPDVTQKEILVTRKQLKEDYVNLVNRHKIFLSFESIIKVIYEEDRIKPLDMFENFTEQGFPEELFMENANLFQDLWNYYPHKVLQGKSPIEMFQDMKKEKTKKNTR